MEKSRDPSAQSLDSLRRLTDSLSVDLTTDLPSQSPPAPPLAPTQPRAISPQLPPGKLPIPRLATKYEPIPIAPRLTTMTEPNRGSPPPPQRALNDVIMTQPVPIPVPRTIPNILPKPSSPTIRPVMTSSPAIVFRGPPGAPLPISMSGQSGKFKLAPATPQNVALAATCRTALLVPKRMIASLRPSMLSSPATSTTMSQYPKPVQTAQVVMDNQYQQSRQQQQQRLRAGAVPFSLKSTGEIMTNVAVSRQAVAPGNMGKFTLVPTPHPSSMGRPVGVVATMDNNKPSILRKPGNVKISMTSSASGTQPARVMTTGRKPVYVKYDPLPSAHQQQSLRHVMTSKRYVTTQSAPHHVTTQSQVVPRPRVTSQPQPRLTSPPQQDHVEILQKLHNHMKAKESVAVAAAAAGPSSSRPPPPLICTSQPPIAPPRMFYIQKKPSPPPPPPPPPAPAPPPPTSPLATHRSKESILRAQRQRMLAESRRKLEQRSAAINRSYAPPPPPRALEARDPVPMVPIRPRPPHLQPHDVTMATRPPPPPPPQPPRLMMPFHAKWRPRPFEMKSHWGPSVIYRPKSTPQQQQQQQQQQHPGHQKRPSTQEHKIENSRAFRIVGGKVERPRVVTSAAANVPVVPPTTLSIATSSPSIMMTMKRPKLIPAGSPVKKPVAVVKRGVEEEGDVAMIDETEVARGKISREKLVFMASLGLVTPNKLREIQAKRSLRKRRSSYAVPAPVTISPEPKKKRLDQGFRITSLSELQDRRRQGKRIPESEDGHEDSCAICRGSGQVLMCDSCSRVYHLHCLDPPLGETPPGVWICPQCRKNLAKKGAVKWSGTLMVVRSYLEHKSECEEERKSLIEKINQLRAHRSRLEERAQTLSSNIMSEIQRRSDILAEEERMRLSLQKLENVVASFAAINN